MTGNKKQVIPRKSKARCREPGCENLQGPSEEARLKRRCDHHHRLIMLKKTGSRARRDTLCSRDSCTRPTGRNDKYCSNECKFLDSRIINDDHVVAIAADPCWSGAETALQNSSCGLASLGGLDNLVGLLQVFARKERQSLYYNITGNTRLTRPQVAMKLAVCHLIANSINGFNTRPNLMTGPEAINDKLIRRIYTPDSDWSRKMFAHRICTQPGIKLQKRISGKNKAVSLREALKTQGGYTNEAIIAVLHRWQPPQRILHQDHHHWLPEAPLITLLCDELRHFEYHTFGKIRSRLKIFRDHFATLLEGYMDVIAMAVFIALQTADRDGLLKLLYQAPPSPMRHQEEVSHHLTDCGHHVIAVYEGGLLYPTIKKSQQIIRRYLRIRDTQVIALRQFYNSIFTIPPEAFLPESVVLVSFESRHHIAQTLGKPCSYWHKKRGYTDTIRNQHHIDIYRKEDDETFEARPAGLTAKSKTKPAARNILHDRLETEHELWPLRYT